MRTLLKVQSVHKTQMVDLIKSKYSLEKYINEDDEVRGDIYISEHIRRRNQQELYYLVKFYDVMLDFEYIHDYHGLVCIKIF